jgi:hypothetical protein
VEVRVPVPVKPVPCEVSKYPDDVIIEGTNENCPEGYACFTIDSAVKIGLTKRDADRFYFDVLACPYVHINQTQYNALDRYLNTQHPLPVK